MNVLCAIRSIVFDNRWHLLLMAAAIGVGYLMGRCYYGRPTDDNDRRGEPTSLTATSDDAARLSADLLRMIQSKIDDIAGNVEELSRLSRQAAAASGLRAREET